MEQLKDLITANQLNSVTTNICEKTTKNFVTNTTFNKEIKKVAEDVAKEISDINIPSKVSDLENDTGFITTSDIPTIPEKTSDLTNDSEFITNVVNDLVNYYLKSETYNKDEVDTLVSAVANIKFEIVNTLPSDDIKTNVIYLVPKSNLTVGNVKEEYINLDGTTTGWERIGDTDIDLEGYVTTDALNTTLGDYVTSTNLNSILSSYVKSSSLSTVATSGEYADIKNTPNIPTKVSELTNDSGFISTGDIPSKVSDLDNDLGFITTGDIPSKVSDIDNDLGFITASDIPTVPTKISELTNDTGFITTGDIPSKTSDITNDSGFITASDIPFVPTKVSELTNDTGFITTGDIPDTTSDLTNDSGFITKAVNDLVNYYLKSETYTKTEVDTIIGAIKSSRFELVDELPTEDIKTNVIYIVPSSDPNAGNIKNELINLDGTSEGWEIIGSTDINLSGYITTSDLNTALANYTTTSDLNTLLANYVQSSSLASVATSGEYADIKNTPNIPTKVSDLTNDSGFITTGDIPSKVSDLDNDLGFITTGDIPSKTSDITNDSGFITASDIPSNVSDFTNDSGFITNTVNSLINYYLKSETYSKTEVDTIVSAIKNSRFEVVNSLPTEDIKTNVIYLTPSLDPSVGDIKDEYINLDGTTSGWERIASTDIKITNYINRTDLNEALADYTTTVDLTALINAKQDKVQYETLPTASADYVGKVFQYIGTTNNDFIHGYFYECVEDSGVYSWVQTDVNPTYTAGDGITIENDEISINAMPAEDIDEIMDVYPNGGNIAVAAGYVPLGTLISYYGETAPQFFLVCDGSTYDKVDYPELARHLLSLTNHTQYEVDGDDTKFKVPDLRGEFLRGTGTNSHENQGSGAEVGEHQDGTVHVFAGGETTQVRTASEYCSNYDSRFNTPDTGAYLNGATSGASYAKFTSRPTNTSVLYCISYKDIYSNPVNDYSTDEKIVGTWIDGKPIYQKTVVLDNVVSDWNTMNNYGVSNIDSLIVATNFIGIYKNGTDSWPLTLFYRNTSDYFQALFTSNGFRSVYSGGSQYVKNAILTIQYTKV